MLRFPRRARQGLGPMGLIIRNIRKDISSNRSRKDINIINTLRNNTFNLLLVQVRVCKPDKDRVSGSPTPHHHPLRSSERANGQSPAVQLLLELGTAELEQEVLAIQLSRQVQQLEQE